LFAPLDLIIRHWGQVLQNNPWDIPSAISRNKTFSFEIILGELSAGATTRASRRAAGKVP
jgi:hypothetical protein